MNRYGSRKFIIAVMTLVVSTWSLFEFLIDAETFKTIVIGVIGLYGTANVAQKIWSKESAR